MKKLIQISLIAILVLVLLQTVAGGSVAASSGTDLGTTTNMPSWVNTSTESVPMAVCLSGIKGMFCVMPNVGWNS